MTRQEEELHDSNSVLTAEQRGVQWHLYVRAAYIFWDESRAIKFTYNVSCFVLIMLMLYQPAGKWIAFALTVVFVNAFMSVIEHVVLPLGVYFNIKDVGYESGDDVDVDGASRLKSRRRQ